MMRRNDFIWLFLKADMNNGHFLKYLPLFSQSQDRELSGQLVDSFKDKM